MKRVLLTLLCVVWAPWVLAQTEFPLINAAQMSSETHIIVGARLDESVDPLAYADQIAARFEVELQAIWPLASVDIVCLVFRTETDPDEVATNLLTEPGVVYAYPIGEFSPATFHDDDADLSMLQGNVIDMRLDEVHAIATGEGVTVALVDTGLALMHPELASQNVAQRDFVGTVGQATPAERHGTAMAAIILAETTSGTGIVGIAPNARLLALRGCWEEADAGPGTCNTFSLARALNFAILNEADVINLSVTGPNDPILSEVLTAALAADIVVVAAEPELTGANLTDPVPSVILASPHPDEAGTILAPGIDILSAEPIDSFDFFSGSSVAAAHVTGAVALMLEVQPGLSAADVYAALRTETQAGDTFGLDLCQVVSSASLGNSACP